MRVSALTDSAMDNALVTIQPAVLRFPFILNKRSTCTLQLKNNTESNVAFQIKTTAPKKYGVSPKIEIIQPNATFKLTFTMQAPRETPPSYECKDIFLVRTVNVREGITAKDITEETFNKGAGEVVNSILKVVYVSPPQTSGLDNVSQDAFLSDQGPEDSEIKSKTEQLAMDFINLEERFDRLQMDVDDFKAKFGQVLSSITRLTEDQSSAVRQWEQQTRDELELLQKIHQSKDKVLFQFLLICWAFVIGIIVGCFLRSKLSAG